MNESTKDYEKPISGFLAFSSFFWILPAIMGVIYGIAYDDLAFAGFMLLGFALSLGWFIRFFRKPMIKNKLWNTFWVFSALSGAIGPILVLRTNSSEEELNSAWWICIGWWVLTTLLSLFVLIKNIQNKSLHATPAKRSALGLRV